MGKPAAVTKSILSDMRKTRSAPATASSANAPPSMDAMTRSPTFKWLTPAPTSVTTPPASLPGENGKAGLVWYVPAISKMSAKLTPAAWMAILTAPGRNGGEGKSSMVSFSGPPHSLHSTALMMISPGWFVPLYPAHKNNKSLLGTNAPKRSGTIECLSDHGTDFTLLLLGPP